MDKANSVTTKKFHQKGIFKYQGGVEIA